MNSECLSSTGEPATPQSLSQADSFPSATKTTWRIWLDIPISLLYPPDSDKVSHILFHPDELCHPLHPNKVCVVGSPNKLWLVAFPTFFQVFVLTPRPPPLFLNTGMQSVLLQIFNIYHNVYFQNFHWMRFHLACLQLPPPQPPLIFLCLINVGVLMALCFISFFFQF